MDEEETSGGKRKIYVFFLKIKCLNKRKDGLCNVALKGVRLYVNLFDFDFFFFLFCF